MNAGPNSSIFYASGIILLLVCALKIPTMLRRRSDALLRSACLLLFVGGLIMLLAAPETIITLNRLAGIPNFAAPVVYATLTAYSGSSLMLIINWRSGTPEQTRRAARLCMIAYSLAIVVIWLLFWAGNAPVEQVTLFDVYYANTPYLREMIVTYLLAHGAASMATSVLCLRWSREVHGSLGAGLRILVAVYLLHVAYDVTRLTAVVARWTGHDLDFLVDKVSPQFATLSGPLGAIGFMLPLVGPRVTATVGAVRQLRSLTPLWRALRDVHTPGAVRTSLEWWRTPPAVLLTSRKTALYDALLALTPYCDPAVHETAYDAALRHGEEESSAAVTADAAMLLAARERQRTAPGHPRDVVRTSTWRAQDLVSLSLAIDSPVVKDLHEDQLPPQKAAHHD
ncbi:hypothetical protein OK074_1332 [Actinobacteria bacterium OK074]|nr:hypothetical protein OK074_1332 [Actinobacteria bacterium OK074]